MGGRSVSYVTRTGSTWAGPIGQAVFRFRVPPHATFLQSGEVLGAPQSPTFVREGQLAYTEVVFEKKNWTPKGDLNFSFATAFGQFSVPRLSAEVLSERAKALGLKEAEQCPRTSIYGMETIGSEAQAQSCRNLVYARWGHPFKKEILNALYYQGGKSWHPSSDYGPRALTRDPAPLQDFSMDWTTRSEREVLKAIHVEGEAEDANRVPVAAVQPGAAPSLSPTSSSEVQPKNLSQGSTPKGPSQEKPAQAPAAKKPKNSGCSIGRTESSSVALWALLLVCGAFARRRVSRPARGVKACAPLMSRT